MRNVLYLLPHSGCELGVALGWLGALGSGQRPAACAAARCPWCRGSLCSRVLWEARDVAVRWSSIRLPIVMRSVAAVLLSGVLGTRFVVARQESQSCQ